MAERTVEETRAALKLVLQQQREVLRLERRGSKARKQLRELDDQVREARRALKLALDALQPDLPLHGEPAPEAGQEPTP